MRDRPVNALATTFPLPFQPPIGRPVGRVRVGKQQGIGGHPTGVRVRTGIMLRAMRPADGLRFGICALAAILALVAVGSDPADARGRRWRHHHARAAAYNPPYAAIVIDANSGRALHEANADSLRPELASITIAA